MGLLGFVPKAQKDAGEFRSLAGPLRGEVQQIEGPGHVAVRPKAGPEAVLPGPSAHVSGSGHLGNVVAAGTGGGVSVSLAGGYAADLHGRRAKGPAHRSADQFHLPQVGHEDDYHRRVGSRAMNPGVLHQFGAEALACKPRVLGDGDIVKQLGVVILNLSTR